MRRRGILILVIAATLAGWAPAARAGELVTLRNGFVQRCDHHTQMDGRVRLYLSTGEDNYIEFAQEEIAAVETTADPPVPRKEQPTAKTTIPLNEADLREILAAAGDAHNLDVDLLASVVKAESDGNTQAVSRAGAQGLMQLMPQTAAQLGIRDRLQPDENVRGGSAYLDRLLSRYHDNLALALAAYNAGPAAVDKYHGIPPYRETQLYVARVIHEFNRRVLTRETQAKRAVASSPVQIESTSR
jgi:soluble lytic murein transglycosylase-like protein